MLPVLLPVMVAARSHKLSTVAYVIGAYNFGLLTSPMWGILAERIKAYRRLFLASFVLPATGIIGMLLLRELSSWLVSAFALGAGAGGAATLATFFIVDFAARAEWEARIAWLQCFNATGQVAGLMLAAASMRRSRPSASCCTSWPVISPTALAPAASTAQAWHYGCSASGFCWRRF
jgi:fucose permease